MSILAYFRPRKKPGEPTPATTAAPPPPATDERTVISAVRDPIPLANRLTVERLHSAIELSEAGDPREIFSIYQDFVLGDTHVQAEMSKRKLAVLGDAMSILPADKTSARDVAAAELVDDQIKALPGRMLSYAHLLDGSLWPCAVAEKVFRRQGSVWTLDRLVSVPHHLQDYSSGVLRLRGTAPDGAITSEFFEVDPTRYIVHVGHLLSFSPAKGGPMRSLLFWTLFCFMDRDWWIRFLDRYGTPFLVGKHESGDDKGRALLTRAFSAASRLIGIAVTREMEVQVVDASKAGADAFAAFIKTARAEQSKLIVGQTLSSDAQPTGLGSGVANLQGQVRDDLRQFDAAMLAETIANQIARQILDLNGYRDQATPRISWRSASLEEVRATVAMIRDLSVARITVSDEGLSRLSEQTGIPLIRDTSAPTSPPPSAMSALSSSDWLLSRHHG